MNREVPSNNREVISDITEARQALASLWHEDVDPVEFQRRLTRQNQSYQEELIEHGYEMTAYLRLIAERRPKERRDINHLRFVSGNELKLSVLKAALGKDNMEVSNADAEGLDEVERQSHESLREMIEEHERQMRGEDVEGALRTYLPYFYAIDVAEHKADAFARAHPKEAIFASDTVVLHGDDILEKPKNIEEARAMFKKISGQEISISSGSVLIATNSSDQTIINRAGVVMRITLRQYSEEDIEQYLQEHEYYQSIAGVIDYADQSAQKLIAKKSVKVEKLTIENDDSPMRVVNIDPSLLSQMRDYCIGMPQEMIQAMIRQFKEL